MARVVAVTARRAAMDTAVIVVSTVVEISLSIIPYASNGILPHVHMVRDVIVGICVGHARKLVR